MAYANNYNWIKASTTKKGIQYLDRNSLINKGQGNIEITTKYLNLDDNNKGEVEENIYEMKIIV